MRSRKPLTRTASIMLEMAGHAAMGVILGLGFSFVLALMDSDVFHDVASLFIVVAAGLTIVSAVRLFRSTRRTGRRSAA